MFRIVAIVMMVVACACLFAAESSAGGFRNRAFNRGFNAGQRQAARDFNRGFNAGRHHGSAFNRGFNAGRNSAFCH